MFDPEDHTTQEDSTLVACSYSLHGHRLQNTTSAICHGVMISNDLDGTCTSPISPAGRTGLQAWSGAIYAPAMLAGLAIAHSFSRQYIPFMSSVHLYLHNYNESGRCADPYFGIRSTLLLPQQHVKIPVSLQKVQVAGYSLTRMHPTDVASHEVT